jgi:hypothetical protein
VWLPVGVQEQIRAQCAAAVVPFASSGVLPHPSWLSVEAHDLLPVSVHEL